MVNVVVQADAGFVECNLDKDVDSEELIDWLTLIHEGIRGPRGVELKMQRLITVVKCDNGCSMTWCIDKVVILVNTRLIDW